MANQERSNGSTGVSRRRFLQGAAVAGATAFLAACGAPAATSPSPSQSAEASPSPAVSPRPSPTPAGPATPRPSPAAQLNVANWPAYIDEVASNPSRHPTLEAFTKKYGTKVAYREAVTDNESFYQTISPALEAGGDPGWDVVVLTDWMVARLAGLGWLETIDTGNTPSFVANLLDVLARPAWDPAGNLRAPWQSGMTGLGYDRTVTGDVASLAALWQPDPRWKGRTWLLTEMRDTIGLTLLKLGRDPAAATSADCDAAIAELQLAVDAGIVSGFLGNEYRDKLASGNLVLGLAWSGDMVQAARRKASLRFAIPTEGAMLWTDSMVIPRGAAHKFTAELFIDFVYDPKIAAQIAAFVRFISPVKGCQQAVAASPDKAVAALGSNPLMFPDAATFARTHTFATLSAADESYVNQQFAALQGG